MQTTVVELNLGKRVFQVHVALPDAPQADEAAPLSHDGHNIVAMLGCKSNERLDNILDRLEAAIASAETTGHVIDEINRPGELQC